MAALTNRTVPCLCAVGMLSLASLATAADPAPAKLANAAQAKYGALFEARGSAKDVVFDKRTDVDMAFDGNAHSRYVVTGVPYTLTVELAEKVPVEKLSFTHSDYAGEAAPKDIEIDPVEGLARLVGGVGDVAVDLTGAVGGPGLAGEKPRVGEVVVGGPHQLGRAVEGGQAQGQGRPEGEAARGAAPGEDRSGGPPEQGVHSLQSVSSHGHDREKSVGWPGGLLDRPDAVKPLRVGAGLGV